MPGTLYHLYFAKLTYEMATKAGIDLDLPSYAAGNLLPDTAKRKRYVHFYTQHHRSRFYVPDLVWAIAYYKEIRDVSLRLGAMAHLYLDGFFTMRVIARYFVFYPSRNRVYLRRNFEVSWSLEEFFSFQNGIYHVYSECNPLLLERENISMQWIRNYVPRDLPLTGLVELDDHNDDNWLDQLERRLLDPPPYVGGMLTYDQLVRPIEYAAQAFVEKMLDD